MLRMFNLVFIVKAAYHAFDNASFAQHYFVVHTRRYVSHVLFYFGDNLHAVIKKFFKHKFFYDIALCQACVKGRRVMCYLGVYCGFNGQRCLGKRLQQGNDASF